MFPQWLLPRSLRRKMAHYRDAARPVTPPRKVRPTMRIEELENRLVPSTVSVLGLTVDTSSAYAGQSLSGSFSVAGQSFSGQSLEVSFNPGTDTIDISGGATATIAGQTVGFTFGTVADPGIVVADGTLTEFNGSVSAPSLTVGSLTLGPATLSVDYVAATANTPEELSISGSASATFGSSGANDVSVTLGNAANNTPGLVIQNGSVVSADMSVSGGFTIDGLTFTANDIEVQYTAGTDTIDISGGASISLGDNSVDVTVGTSASPGIVIQNGSLQSLDVTVDGNVTLFGVSLTADDLEIQYSNNSLTITGGLGFSVGSEFGAEIDMTGGGLTVNTQTGAVSIDTSNLAMTGSLTIAGDTFTAGFALDANGHLNDLSVSYSSGTGEGLEVGDTGLFVTALSGSVDNLQNLSNLDVKLSATVDEGGQITIAGTSYSLLSATGSIEVTPGDLKIAGTIEVGGGILGNGTATLDLNWGTGIYSANVHVGMMDDVFQYSGSITLTQAGDVSIDATAGVYLPSNTPSAIKEAIEAFNNGSDNLGKLEVDIEIQPGNAAASYGEVSIDAGGKPVIGFKVDGNGHFSLTGEGAAQVAAALHQIGQTAEEVGNVLKDAYNQTVNEAGQLMKNAGYAAKDVAKAVESAYKETAQDAAKLMKDVGYAAADVASALQSVYQQTAQEAAQLMKAVGYTVSDVASALQSVYQQTAQEAAQVMQEAGYAASQVASALQSVYQQTAQEAAQVMQEAGYAASQVASALQSVYQQTAQEAAQVMQEAGYAVSQVASALQTVYQETAQEATQVLQDVWYNVTQIASALQSVYQQTAQETAQLLQQAGYVGVQIASAMQSVYQQTAQEAAQTLYKLGCDIDTIASSLQNVYYETAQEAVSVLQNVTSEVYKIGNYYAYVFAYSVDEMTYALATVYQQTAQEVGVILNNLGYFIDQIASTLKDEFGMAAGDVANILGNTLGYTEGAIQSALSDAGYAESQIKSALNELGQDIEKAFSWL